MKRRAFLRGAAALAALSSTPLASLEQAIAKTMSPLEPLLTPWGGPHGGIPPFGTVKATDIKPGLMKGMDLLRSEVQVIAANKSAPTFENTIASFEDSGRALGRANIFFGVYTSTMNDKAMRAVETEMTPLLAALDDEITQNAALFQRIQAV